MSKLFPFPKFTALDSTGSPLSGGKVYFYEAGTSTPKDTYTDDSEGTANSNPVILDANGQADIWLGSGFYKITLDSSSDVQQWSVDNVSGDDQNTFGSTVISTAVTYNVIASNNNNMIIGTATLTLNLLAATTAGEGFFIIVKNDGSGTVTIDPNGTETINGSTTLTMEAGESATIICNGSEWYSLFLSTVNLDGDNAFSGDNSHSGAETFTGTILTPDDGELTIATGVITATGAYHTVDTEGDAASDDLETITAGDDGQLLRLRIEDDARNVVIKTTGNIVTPYGDDVTLDTTSYLAAFIYDGTLSKWILQTNALEPATNAEVESETAGKYADASQITHNKGVAKAYLHYNQATDTLNSSYNITSVADTATGRYTVTFDTAFASATGYTITHTDTGFSMMRINTQSTGSCILQTYNIGGTLADYTNTDTFFGEQ